MACLICRQPTLSDGYCTDCCNKAVDIGLDVMLRRIKEKDMPKYSKTVELRRYCDTLHADLEVPNVWHGWSACLKMEAGSELCKQLGLTKYDKIEVTIKKVEEEHETKNN